MSGKRIVCQNLLGCARQSIETPPNDLSRPTPARSVCCLARASRRKPFQQTCQHIRIKTDLGYNPVTSSISIRPDGVLVTAGSTLADASISTGKNTGAVSFRHNIHGGSIPIIVQPFEYQMGIHRIPTCNMRNRNTQPPSSETTLNASDHPANAAWESASQP